MRKKWACAPMIILLALLAGCGGEAGSEEDQLVLDIRGEYLAMTNCQATAKVTADYGQRVYEYTISLSYEQEGDTVLTVLEPEEVSGITARISDGETSLEFDGVQLETGPLPGDGLSPIEGLPALLTCAREGYIWSTAVETLGEDGPEALHVCYRDPEGSPGTGTEGALWFDLATHALLRGEISVDGYTVIQCEFTEFTYS